MSRALDLHGLIGKIAIRSFPCACGAKPGERCAVFGTSKASTNTHAGRWKSSERLLRPHTHPGVMILRKR